MAKTRSGFKVAGWILIVFVMLVIGIGLWVHSRQEREFEAAQLRVVQANIRAAESCRSFHEKWESIKLKTGTVAASAYSTQVFPELPQGCNVETGVIR